MSCISSNFSSFFLNSLNDPSEFAKYLSNGELKFSSFEDFQAFGGSNQTSTTTSSSSSAHANCNGNGVDSFNNAANAGMDTSNYAAQQQQHYAQTAGAAATNVPYTTHQQQQQQTSLPPHHTHAQQQQQQHNQLNHNNNSYASTSTRWPNNAMTTAAGTVALPLAHNNQHHQQQHPHHHHHHGTAGINAHAHGGQHFDGSFEFLKYLRHSNDYAEMTDGGSNSNNSHATTHTAQQQQQHQQQHQQQPQSQTNAASLIDLDTSTTHKSRSSRKVAALLSTVSRQSNNIDASTLDVFDHDSKHTIFDLQHHMANNSSNSNESSLDITNMAFNSSHLNASNSNTSSEGAVAGNTDFSILNASANAPKPLATFIIQENFDVHPSHKVEEGIFQHMNKLPSKKKENLKQLGVLFTGQMTLAHKSIVVENFIKFCQEYDIKDHRPFLSLNQSGLNKPEQIKFARYLGQGLPTFTLFCIYSNFKNLFCTKRTEIYTKDGYNLPYILDKTKRFLANTTAGNNSNKQSHNATTLTTTNNTQPQTPKPSQSQIQTTQSSLYQTETKSMPVSIPTSIQPQPQPQQTVTEPQPQPQHLPQTPLMHMGPAN